MKKLIVGSLLVVSGVVASVVGCGSSSASYSCCLNGSYFQCPDSASAQQCTTACTRDSSKDDTCK